MHFPEKCYAVTALLISCTWTFIQWNFIPFKTCLLGSRRPDVAPDTNKIGSQMFLEWVTKEWCNKTVSYAKALQGQTSSGP